MTSATSATSLSPAMCGACKHAAKCLCLGCGNMPYCSFACQDKDKEIHELLCDSFKEFQTRPGENFRRGIFFQQNETKPRFVWLEFDDSYIIERLTTTSQEQHLGDGTSRAVYFDHTPELDREYDNHVEVHHRANFVYDGSKSNECLEKLLGSPFFRGPLVAQGNKYRFGEDDPAKFAIEDYDPEEDDDFPLMAMDLDTTSLNPIIAELKLTAKRNECDDPVKVFTLLSQRRSAAK